MEEAVETLAEYPSSWTDWPFALALLYKDSHHVPLPKDRHQGILPWGKVEETSCGQISQLDVCQLLSTGPQVVYPSGLNRHYEPVITTLPELLSSGTSIIASKHLYLQIDIPPKEESDTKAPPIGKVSIIQATNPHKSPLKLKGSMTAEVNHLLDWAITEVSSCESEQSSLEKITTAAVTMSPPQKSVSVPPVNTSSQASIKEVEGYLEDISTHISPIATVYSSRSVSPLVDPSEVQANANRDIDNMLHLKRSLDVKRQRATWIGGVVAPWPKLSFPRQSWSLKPISEQLSWRLRQLGAIQQLRWPVAKPSVMLKPRKLPRLWCLGGTWQIHVELRGASLQGGKQKSSWGPFLLSGCPVPQSTAT